VDLAKAHIAAMRRILGGEVETVETYNVGTGRGLSVLEILNAFETVNDVKVPHEIVGRRAGDIEQVWADPSYANKMLKWKAEASLEETVRSIWKWQLHLAEQEENKETSKGGKMLGGS
jgi:UDP-glucose 4-epimerase